MNAVSWFEIAVNDFDRAKSFYESVFNVELSEMEMDNTKLGMWPWEPEQSGSDGAIIKGEGSIPSAEGTIVYLEVDDIESTLERINANGGSTIFPKTSLGEHGSIAHFNDLDGNRIALHSD